MADPSVTIEGDTTCKDWQVIQPTTQNAAAGLLWSVQATAPMSFKGISSLFQNVLDASDSGSYSRPADSYVLPAFSNGIGKVGKPTVVTSDFFQASPNGMTSGAMQSQTELLGYLSLLITYIKGAQNFGDVSPKSVLWIMPRTDFTSMYNLVKSPMQGNLLDLVQKLVCYTNEADR